MWQRPVTDASLGAATARISVRLGSFSKRTKIGQKVSIFSGRGAKLTGSVEVLRLGKHDVKLTHQIFRYPAKFHPPVVRALLQRYTEEGQTVFDPFVGSGTSLVESSVLARPSIGMDIDPVAAEISFAKTRFYDMASVRSSAAAIGELIGERERPASEYSARMFKDISETAFKRTCKAEDLWVPQIPRLQHWFRRYVVVDLARILQVINSVSMDDRTRSLMRTAFAAIIRNSSNADPVPVSGLEYTSHMKRKDAAGRLINPFALMRASLKKCVEAAERYAEHIPKGATEPQVYLGDAMQAPRELGIRADVVLTSPPYHNAVDYYRRHQLEMFWLGHTEDQEDRLALLPKYIGRPSVAAKDPLLAVAWNPGGVVGAWEEKMRVESPSRAADFRHYVTAMSRVFDQMSDVLDVGCKAVFVVGHSRWKGQEIPTGDIFEEISRGSFSLVEKLSYPIVNRYMSYRRHNAADINEEYVLVMDRV